MTSPFVDQELVKIALERVDGARFETFANALLSAVIGYDFSPLGGTHDGGADGFLDSGLYVATHRAGTFFQASLEEDHRGKIRRTVARLRDFGRDPVVIFHVTPHPVRYLDREEDELSAELDVTVRIRDLGYILGHINDSPGARAAFHGYLAPLTKFLESVGAAPLIAQSEHVTAPAVFVFLQQELERRHERKSLPAAVTDSLILWALEGTDPDEGKLLSEEELLDKIVATVPSARQIIEPLLDERLRDLSSKHRPGGRQISWHQKENRFALPFATRSRIAQENKDDESLRLRVIEILGDRALSASLDPSLTPADYRTVGKIALTAVELTFERGGLEFAKFLHAEDGNEDFPIIADSAREAATKYPVSGKKRLPMAETAVAALRESFYNSSEEERLHFTKLSHTYALLFILNTEPRLVEYFQEMAGDFYLYVGTDIIVRALSERYLPVADQMTRNMLHMAVTAGATLVLAESVLDEVISNLRGADAEYRNFFAGLQDDVTFEIARNVPKILLRSYFYARLNLSLGDKRPGNWPAFVGQFCNYSDLQRLAGREQLRGYLQSVFRMTYEGRDDLLRLVDSAQLEDVTDAISEVKEFRRLAENDALLALAVYGRREEQVETSQVSEFGYRTWWLTHEAKLLRKTGKLVAEHGGKRYVLRPEFLLNFFALAPSSAEVRRAYANVFPTLLGVKLAKRMDGKAFHELMNKVKEADLVEDGRRQVLVADLSDKLKSDMHREYARSFPQE